MNEKALKVLEFYKIRERLVSFAVSPRGKEQAEALSPMTHYYEIHNAQRETTEAVAMTLRKGNLPLGGIREVRPQLKRAAMGGILSIPDLMAIGEFLYVCEKLKKYAYHENKNESYERLDGQFALITPAPALEREISRCILSETQLADDASPGLRSVRRDIRNAGDKVKDQLNAIINSPSYRTMLQDNVVTIRNDRYCVPVRAEYRNAFSGMVHDQSHSGSTLFIEPLGVVQLNNRIKELQAKEKQEVEKILKTLSEAVAQEAPMMEASLNVVTHLDFVFAKAALSLAMNGTEPEFNGKGIVDLNKARHPLLDPQTVVPIHIYLGKDFTTLLITGPNTGGKTVALKTLGLLTLMGQAGLHIPAAEHASLSVFDEVYADIGDEQSIEQSLSTFSSHMKNIVEILESTPDNALALFDELGAGTDPTEGAALAMAVIEHLRRRGVRTAVTTHYSELKVYALSTEGVENASCEFDVETLRPTYRLLIGIPGKSNAFAISRRLGLPEEIIAAAQGYVSQEEVRFEDVITDLEISKKTVVLEQERAEQYRKEAEALKKDVEKQKARLEERRDKMLQKAQEEARQIYQQAREDADRLIKEINKEARAGANQAKMNAARAKIKEGLAQATENVEKQTAQKKARYQPLQTTKPGDAVYIVSFDQRGTALSEPDNKGEVLVQTSLMKIKVPLSDLAVATGQPSRPPERSKLRNVRQGKAETVSSSIDCRGMTSDECLMIVDKYLDDAYLAGVKTVTIIHGKGTGALRAAVQSYLRKNARVKSFRPGLFGEGEMGVTVVELK